MNGWLKALMLTALLTLGMPTLAFAHAGHRDDAAAVVEPLGYGTADVGFDTRQSYARQHAVHFIENSNNAPLGEDCDGLCCCQDMMRCGSSGCSLSALISSPSVPMFDRKANTLSLLTHHAMHRIRRSFGLERPPKG